MSAPASAAPCLAPARRGRANLFRAFSRLLILGGALLALLFGLWHLQSIFIEERDEALAGIGARQGALAQYAKQELEQELRRQLDQAAHAIRQALADPLLPANHLLHFDGADQQLPRLVTLGGGARPAASSVSARQPPACRPSGHVQACLLQHEGVGALQLAAQRHAGGGQLVELELRLSEKPSRKLPR